LGFLHDEYVGIAVAYRSEWDDNTEMDLQEIG
jgi:hypothetical protein